MTNIKPIRQEDQAAIRQDAQDIEVSRDVQGNTQGNIADPTPTTEGGFT